MSTLKATTIEPATGTNVTLGTTGDTVALPGNTLVLDTWKDSGGNTLFTSNGSGVVSSVNSGLAGAGPVLIQSQTASGSANISFTSGLDSTYDRYMFVLIGLHPANNNVDIQWQSSIDGGTNYNVSTTTTMFRATHDEGGNNGALTYRNGRDAANSTSMIPLTGNCGNDGDMSQVGVFNLYKPSSTTYVKQFTARASSQQNEAGDDYTIDWISAGFINTTSAVNAIKFQFNSGNIDDGTIKLYGVT